jgi:AFG3 family protein
LHFFGEFTSGAQDDLVKTTRLAYMQVQSLGFSDAIGWLSFDQDARVSEETQKTIDSEARKIVEQAMKRTHGKATVLNVQRDREKI